MPNSIPYQWYWDGETFRNEDEKVDRKANPELYKSGYIPWYERDKKLKGHYYNPITEAMEPRDNPSPHLSSKKLKEKYEHEQATFNPTLGKFVGQKTGRKFPDMSSAVTQNKRYDEVEFANRIVDGKEPLTEKTATDQQLYNNLTNDPARYVDVMNHRYDNTKQPKDYPRKIINKKPIHKQLEDLKKYHQGNSEQLSRGKKQTRIANHLKNQWGIAEKPKAKEKSTWDVIYESMTPLEKGQWNLEQRKKNPNTAKWVGNVAPSEKKGVSLSLSNSLNNLEEIQAMEADSAKRAATFRKAMEPIPDEDLHRGLGTFDPRYKKGKA